MRFPSFIFLLLILPVFISCNNKLDNEIKVLLDSRKTAFEEKNTEKYSNLILSTYNVETRSGNKNKEDVIKDFKLNTTPFDSIEMTHSDRKVQDENGKAKVVQKTSVLLAIEDQKTTYDITEVLILEKEDGKWKISKESSLDLFRGFVFGKQN